MPRPAGSLPSLKSDLLLLHAPAVFEFRRRRDIYFPFLGTSGDVPITPLYEYFPMGFKTLQRYLTERQHSVRLLNLSSLFLRYPWLLLEEVVGALETRFIGIDLHWMVHVQGSLAVAEKIKALRPDITTIFGGISSTYYADELIRYGFVDMVMRGYDTHVPMDLLLQTPRGANDYGHVPNLLWKDRTGVVRDNPFSHKPDSFGCGIDWSVQPEDPGRSSLPILELLSAQNAGCAYNCGWCGGSREAFRRIFGRKKAMARKPLEEIAYEFETMERLSNIDRYHFYSVGSYNESRAGLDHFLDRVAASRFKSISYEQYHLTPEDVLRRMVDANKRTIITLSPESHDPHVAKLAGRGVYTNEQMEAWLELALEVGVSGIDIWYFIGMPEQDARSVQEMVDYCGYLLEKFKGSPVNPMVCPMIPFLDPGSTFFTYPRENGYRVFHRTVEEHRRGMERASIINRINYETDALTRRDLVHVGFTAVRRLMEAKRDTGFLPRSMVNVYNDRIDDALAFIDVVHEADCLEDPRARASALDALGDDIEARNRSVLFGGVMNQALPINREVGGRWFDELGWSPAVLDGVHGNAAEGVPSDRFRGDQLPYSVATTRGTLPVPPV